MTVPSFCRTAARRRASAPAPRPSRAASPGSPPRASRSSRCTRRGPGRPGLPGHLPRTAAVPARAVPDDVHHPAVDDPPVRRLLHRRGVQRLLPPQPRRRPEGPVGRVRPADPPRLRLRPPARGRRRRHGRRGHRLDLRHAAAVRRHPARPDDRVDDDERRGAAGAGALHRRGRGAGRDARAARRDHPERHPQGVHGPQHLHLPAGAVDADHLRHLRLHLGEDAASSTRSRSPATTCRRPGRPPTWSWPTRWPTASSTCRAGLGRRARRRRVRAAAQLLLGDRHELLHGGRQAAGRPAAVGQAGERVRARRTRSRCRCAPTRQTSGWSLTAQDVYNNVGAHLRRGDGRHPGPHPVAAHQRPRRGARAADRLLGPHRPQHPAVAPAGVRDTAGHRPVGRQLLRRAAHRTTSPSGPGPTSRRSRSSAAWPRPSRPASPSCASRRRPPAPRPASTPAASRSSASTSTGSTDEEHSTCSRSTTPTSARQQIAKLERLRAERDADDGATAARGADQRRADGECGNLLELAVDAARAKATVGEISDALEKVFGRHTAPRSARSPACTASEAGDDGDRRAQEVLEAIDAFEAAEGRRPAHPGRQDGPGRPRPRPEGDRHGVRRPRLRRRHRPAVPDAGGGRPAGGRGRRARRRASARSPPGTSRWCPRCRRRWPSWAAPTS